LSQRNARSGSPRAISQNSPNDGRRNAQRGLSLVQEGDRAKHLYILLEGRVSMTIGDRAHTVYTVDHGGEVFGWSSQYP
jgi:CRP-like cAMP-binding protein